MPRIKIFFVSIVVMVVGIFSLAWFTRSSSQTDIVPPLIKAARTGDIETVKKLIASGSDVNVRSNSGGTALFFAAGNDHLDVVTELLRSGASITAEDEKGQTAIFANLQNEKDSLDVIRFLLLKGADINHRDKFGMNALFASVDIGGSHYKTELLIEKGIEINVKSMDEDFPLRIASSWGDLQSVQLLLKSGADPNLQRKDGHTALMEACRQNNKDLIVLLLKKGASASIKNSEGLIAVDMLPTDSVEMRTLLQARH